MDLRRIYRWIRARAYVLSGQSGRALRRLDGSRAAVLAYHRVLPAEEAEERAVEPGMYVTPETFDRHLQWLGSHFRVLPLHEIFERLAAGRSLPPGACAITFDDGWRDNRDHALPALERHGMPATIFIVTERVGTEGAFWPDEVARRLAPLARGEQEALAERLGIATGGDLLDAFLSHLKGLPAPAREETLDRLRAESREPRGAPRELLDWDELALLARGGFDVESHGATHAILTSVPESVVERELRSARECLRERGFGRHALLAYPSGAHDEMVRRVAHTAGYTAGFTTEAGLADAATDPMAIPRLSVHDDATRTRAEFLYGFRPSR